MTNNHWSNGPVTDVKSINIRCYDTQSLGTAQTVTVSAGSKIGFSSNQPVSHLSTTSIYAVDAPLYLVKSALTYDILGKGTRRR